LDLPDHEAALKTLCAWLQGHEIGKELHAVGHRVMKTNEALMIARHTRDLLTG